MNSISLSFQDDIALIHMDDEKANALNTASLGNLNCALDEAKGAKAVVLAGRPGVFSGGLDLKKLPQLDAAGLREVLSLFGETMLRVFSWNKPVVAACTGHALAGGMILMMGADERYAADGPFKLGLTETQLGLSLPRFVVEMARTVVPAHGLHRVVVRGDTLTPTEAAALGLIDRLVSAEEIVPTALKRASQLASLPSAAYAHNKAAIRAEHAEVGHRAFAKELESFVANFGTALASRG